MNNRGWRKDWDHAAMLANHDNMAASDKVRDLIVGADAHMKALEAEVAELRKDKELIDWLQRDENPVDSLYFDDGAIIDIGGKSAYVRKALREAMEKDNGQTEQI